MLPANTVLQDRYGIVRQLGQGGMGTVYEAIDRRLNSIVAIKETRLTTEDARRAFEREASLLANLRYRSLPSVIDHFSENESQYLVMQFIPGDDLGQMLEARRRPFPRADVLRWGDEILRTLEYLHGHNPPILHRDIKPSNLKLTDEGELFLLDFGLAKGAAGQMPTLLTSRSVKGYTPVYSPLEQIHGGGTDPRSDLYAVGATLYHLMTGVAPVDAPARYLAIEDEQPDPLKKADEVNSDVPHAVGAALSSAMAMNRRHRPSNAAKMRRLLSEASDPQTRAPGEQGELETARVTPPPTQPALAIPAATTPAPGASQHAVVTPQATIPTPLPQVSAPVTARMTSTPALPPPSQRLKTIVTIFAIVVVVFLLAVGSTIFVPRILSRMRANSNNAANGTQTEVAAQDRQETKPTVTPTAISTPEFVKVRLRLISQGASGCSTYQDEKVTLTVKGQTFTATTNRSGFASFSDVPCGTVARITAPGVNTMLNGNAPLTISRSLECKSEEIYLGSYGDLQGKLVTERTANSCFK